MAYKILILGDSGTGKSASLRNFKDDEILVINSAGKPLPFKNHFETVTPRFDHLTDDILDALKKTMKKVVVVDDAQYIMSFQYMRRIKEAGWDKWNDIQGDFFNIIQMCDYLPNDTIVYFLSHIQRDEQGHEKIKTMGKMLDEKITIEGLFTTVLKTSVQDGKYYFITQNNGLDTVKSPMGMFESYAIDNDLKYVDTKIRNYYEIGDYVSDSEVEELDEKAAAPEIEKPESSTRKRKRRASKKEDDQEHGETQEKELAEAPTEEAKEEAKPRKRRRRKAQKTETETLDLTDDELPF